MTEQIEQRWIQVRGFDIHYSTAGEGQPLVLLHGEGDSGAFWQ